MWVGCGEFRSTATVLRPLRELEGRHCADLPREPLLAVDEMKIVGAHNQVNALAAMAPCDAVGIPARRKLAVLRAALKACLTVPSLRASKWGALDQRLQRPPTGDPGHKWPDWLKSVKGRFLLLAGNRARTGLCPVQACSGQIDHM